DSLFLGQLGSTCTYLDYSEEVLVVVAAAVDVLSTLEGNHVNPGVFTYRCVLGILRIVVVY
ncbi:hypothetical protein LINGRAHAP2_LOCUS15168, partial [Linum grandiflorum]